jgi:hypothetical protein
MVDLSTFNPQNLDQLFKGLVDEGRAAVGSSVDNIAAVPPQLKTLAEATLKTATALAEGRIDAETAKTILEDRKETLQQALEFEAYMALVVAQKLTNAVFNVIGAVIRNRTGINLFPGA